MQKAYEPSGQLLFEEKQKFPKWVIVLVLVVVSSSVLLTLVASFATGQQHIASGSGSAWLPLVIIVPIEAIMLYLFYVARLEKVITSNGLYYRWLPLQKMYRVIEQNLIEKVELRKSPMHYGTGWKPGYGKVHNLSGQGVQFYLLSGKKIFFGSDKPEQFQAAIDQMLDLKQKSRSREF